MNMVESPAMSKLPPALPSIAGQVLTYQEYNQIQTLHVGSPAWYRWLQTATIFTFTDESGTITVRHELSGNKRGAWYWRAHGKHAGKRRRLYLGRSEEVTLERLHEATRLMKSDTATEHTHVRSRHRSLVPGETGDSQRVPTVLPTPLSSLIARERDIEKIQDLLLRPGVRELTLTGAGGVGKTRLALASAASVRDQFADGVCYVSLAPVHDADLVFPTIAQAEGLKSRGNASPIESLQVGLRGKHHLLVLDNFEQVIAAAPAITQLLAVSPGLKVLVTSREALKVRGEQEFVVQPLSLPGSQHGSDNEAISSYGAVALFVERTREIQPSFELNADNASLITEICQRLDGLPLAIELAVSRLKVLSLPGLLSRLEHRLNLLTSGPRDLPVRQQTLRQTIDWSYDLLSHNEQRLFRLLAVFVDGCTLDAAESVFGMIGGDHALVLDVATSLLDKHLLYQRRQDDAQSRLLMHETIREYGLEALAANHELEAARQAHAEYYLGQAETLFAGARLAAWLSQLAHEYANLDAALRWALERPASQLAQRLERTLFRFWEGHGRLNVAPNTPERFAIAGRSDFVETRYTAHSIDSATLLEHSAGEQEIKLDRATAMLEGGPGDARHPTQALYLLGVIAWIIGDLDTARMYTEEGLIKARSSADRIMSAYLLNVAGQIALEQGEDVKARTLLEAGLSIHREVGDTLGSLNALFFLERIHASRGERTQARAYAEEHLARSKAIGFSTGTVGTLTFLGRLALEENDAVAAGALFDESLALLREMRENLPLAVATNLQGIGVTLATIGRLTEAVQLWGAAAAMSALLPEERTFVSRESVIARAELGEQAFAVAWTTGQAMSLEQALVAVENIVCRGRSNVSSSGNSQVQPRHTPSLGQQLTLREEEVLRLVARGLTDAQVAEALVISPRTVNAHLRSIYAKLNISSRNAATYFALEHHLI